MEIRSWNDACISRTLSNFLIQRCRNPRVHSGKIKTQILPSSNELWGWEELSVSSLVKGMRTDEWPCDFSLPSLCEHFVSLPVQRVKDTEINSISNTDHNLKCCVGYLNTTCPTTERTQSEAPVPDEFFNPGHLLRRHGKLWLLTLTKSSTER